MNAADAIGIVGVICYQVAYAGLQLGRMLRDDRLYFYLNLFGPCCLLYSLLFHFNLAAAVSQVLWLVWSLLGVAKGARARRRKAIAAAGTHMIADGSALHATNGFAHTPSVAHTVLPASGDHATASGKRTDGLC
ncbi:hypothetical protein CUJ89_22060 [Burkholderia pyrrocinia]|uniref:CBU-0592-like domain-containing protein n=1 Tax=Burkholderia pyrrocinia TaxID=60550 RepID=A0A2Z5N379_BURPY|nr:hypothetical protein [Burkholderia pyrrocinia]AXF23147.1 hypothetical protein CUJ89_22060 [Burkholderia pyrrocinia]